MGLPIYETCNAFDLELTRLGYIINEVTIGDEQNYCVYYQQPLTYLTPYPFTFYCDLIWSKIYCEDLEHVHLLLPSLEIRNIDYIRIYDSNGKDVTTSLHSPILALQPTVRVFSDEEVEAYHDSLQEDNSPADLSITPPIGSGI